MTLNTELLQQPPTLEAPTGRRTSIPRFFYQPLFEPANIPGQECPRVSRLWLTFWAVFVILAYALLWTRWWYPLSDSSLYLSLARALAEGRGFTYMGEPHRLVPPLTPLFFAGIMRLGGGIGTIQAVCTGLILFAHAMCFLTLRRWVGERISLAATLATALSYWVFINAFTIMSEPLCLALLWSGLFVLGAVPTARHRWSCVIGACALLLGAAASRAATVILIPGAVGAMCLTVPPSVPWSRRLRWAALIFVVFATAYLCWQPPRFVRRFFRQTSGQIPTEAPAVAPPSGGLTELSNEAGDDSNGKYRVDKFMQGVPHTLLGVTWEMPVLAGRWIMEGLAMPSKAGFQRALSLRSRTKPMSHAQVAMTILTGILAILVAILCLVGAIETLRRKQWWILGLSLYFGVFWLQWGMRVKPRYMAPIVPLLFIYLWLGFLTFLRAVSPRLRALPKSLSLPALAHSQLGCPLLMALVIAVMLANAPAWGIEFYVHHLTPAPFYDAARSGGFNELVDIGDYLQKHAGPSDIIYVNRGAYRRIVFFLGGHKVEVQTARIILRNGKVVVQEVHVNDWKDTSHINRFLKLLPADARYAVVFSENPPMPDWHLPLRKEARAKSARSAHWRLYIRGKDGQFAPVAPPHSNGRWISSIPPATI